MDDESKKIIQEKFEVGKGGQSFTDLAKLFYKIRNNFIHNADLIAQFNKGITIHTIDNKTVKNDLSLDDIKLIFEIGFLIYFGYDKANFNKKTVVSK